jgi:hypothetical protein
MTAALYAVGQFCVKRRFVVLGVWFVAAIALGGDLASARR